MEDWEYWPSAQGRGSVIATGRNVTRGLGQMKNISRLASDYSRKTEWKVSKDDLPYARMVQHISTLGMDVVIQQIGKRYWRTRNHMHEVAPTKTIMETQLKPITVSNIGTRYQRVRDARHSL